MNVSISKLFCFFFLFFIKDTSFQQIQSCKSDWSAKYNITWPETLNITLSEPPCVNEDKEFLYRRCLNGFWESEPRCSYIQEKSPPNCPEDFIFSKTLSICYQIINQTFPPKCLFEDILPFDSYKNVIGNNNGPFWMPVARNLDNGLGFFYWIEASSKYGSYFDEKYVFKDKIKDKNCLLYYNDSYIEAVSCSETHASVCAYKPLNQVDDPLCFSEDAYACYRNDFAANSSCFCYGNSANDYPKAGFLKPYQNSIYRRLTNETCSIGLEKIQNGTYIWSYSKEEINYTYWSKDAVFDSTHIYGAFAPSGWILTEEQAECVVFLKEKKIPEPNIRLSFNDTNKNFEVKITDVKGVKFLDSKILLHCFTNVDSLDLITRLSILNHYNSSQSEAEFTFEPLGTTPGSYWCEGFKYANNKPIKTSLLVIRPASNSLFEFVSIMKVNYNKEINPLSKDLISLLNNSLFGELDTIKYFKDSYIARIMSIVDIDEAKAEVLVNIHFTQISNTNLNNTFEEEYLFIETVIKTTLHRLVGVRIEIINFLSADYCMKETTKLTWPTTGIYWLTKSEEFCIDSYGYQAFRHCTGDFIRGARWSEADEDCTIFKESSYTEYLKNAEKSNDILTTLEFLHSIQNQNYQPIDLYLISNIFIKLRDVASHLDQSVVISFVEIVNNLLETSEEVLRESQSKLNATDTILEAITTTLVNYSRSCDIQRSNLYFNSAKFVSSKVSGIMIVQNENITITPIIDDCSKTKIQTTENLRGAVCLSPELLEQDTYKIIITIYFKDSLFNNEIQTVAPIDTIFGITVINNEGIDAIFYNPIWVFQPFRGDSTNCFYWDFHWDYRRPLLGIWKKESKSLNLDHLQFCQFYRNGHFVFTEELNVTPSLMNILNSNASVFEIMDRLTEVSKRYNEFASIDVFLVGKIFEKVNKLNETNNDTLEHLAKIVNNLQQIQRETLLESQVLKSATDNILQEIDKMLQNYNYKSPVKLTDKQLFKIIIYDTKTTDFSGVTLIESDQNLKTQILIGDKKIEDIARTENLTSAVVISPELKNQLKEDGKIIITITSTNSLFNEKKSRFKNISKIFGVILPKIEKFDGPISVLYKIDQNSSQQEDCVHWLYGQKQNSFWFKDQESESLSSLNHCRFWHTTHFALLLLDYNEQNDFLDWITAFNSALSLFGLSCIIFTGIRFRKWRSNGGNQILLNFVLVMILQIIFFYLSSTISQNNYSLCTCIGILLHFFTISEFLWMLVIAFLQYKRFVQVFGGPPEHILVKSCILGWIFPLFPVMCVFLADQNNYVNSNVGLCYPSELGLYLGVWFPVSLILIINFIIFVCIIYNVAYTSNECGNIVDDEAIFKLRLGILLFSMLGLTWIFGLLSDIEKIFLYLFCITATLQGFVMFVFFVIFNVETKLLYSKTLKKCCSKNI